ncbi:MAG: hypothetical protein U0U46_17090 [Saprospiraceae bacterium]
MTQERFLNMLGDPDLLATISYQELKTLALAYPYAHNLHYLLALKARQDNHPDFDRALAAASANSLSRPRLFHLIAPQRVTVVEDVLELRAIEAVQRELEARVPIEREEKNSEEAQLAEARPLPEATPAPPVSADETEDLPAPVSPEKLPDHFDRALDFGQWLDQFNLPALPVRPRRPASETNEPSEDTPAPIEPETPRPVKPEPPSSVAQTLAERSVASREDVVSETMARIFAAQGHRERAIAMYERLRLAIPEKSDYFAAEIDKLKK